MRKSVCGIAILLGFLLVGCNPSFFPGEVHWNHQAIDDNVASDSSMIRLIAPYKEELEAQMEEVIGRLDTTLYHQQPDGTLGSWISDALAEEMEEYTGNAPDFALHNFGGIRLQQVSKGSLTVGKVYEVLPFDNALVRLTADSATIDTLVAHIMKRGGWPLSQSIDIHCNKAGGYSISIAGKPLSDDRTYDIAMPDYIANGGDDCSFLTDNARVSTGYFVRDIIVEHVREETAEDESITATSDRRIHCTEKEMR